jgi:hypothetical protein
MGKVQKPSNSVCYTPSSEPYRIYEHFSVWKVLYTQNYLNECAVSDCNENGSSAELTIIKMTADADAAVGEV